jgi:hypothetical protein
MAQSQVLLGSVVFTSREVPDVIPWGGKQQAAIHKQLGGQRVIDTMGPDPRPITWSGLFYGPSASQRARLVDTLKNQGGQVGLQWGSFSFIVVITDFEPDYKHEWECHYKITCEVVQVGPSPPGPTVDTQLQSDFSAITAISTLTFPAAI